ncbi:putative regulator [Streptomyces scabiei 87.22]|uniref:Putative regulator n=1 Tax=Streptomyces scabiei (strain 87.22) TaxID=680198 RepID=C9YYH7_STRSW|nr:MULTISPECIES: LuxR family transcriptional regulator [Streptomyces]MBP5911523.1 AAA family ATPase [Streptomyces sp. LBUM 1486]MDX2581257.1 AAA family ATPase [Streptomyces scabiei]MDX2658967.1 AAA family ATPase [Streptomyces scabiei]MDX2726740.1 AAA family ATPase [Streptomyces scabiei]MDX2871416.1 AAA family ATPase [Streptomyces scabiei]
MILIDRKDELSALREFLADSRHGNGHVVLVSGSVGIGKSELLYAFAEEASSTGSEVLRAVGREEERDVPFGIVHQLVRDISLPAPLRAQMTVLEDSFASGHPPARHESATLQAHVARSLCRALLDAAGAGGLLLCVDDVQHADSASLSCLLQLLPHTRSAPVMLVFSRPDSARHGLPLLSTELLRHPFYRRVRLAPLSPEGTTELTTKALGTEEAQALGPVYHSLSGGNPLLVHALLRDHRDRQADGDGDAGSEVPPAGEEFAQAVLACLHGREPDVLGVARTMALLDSCSSPDRIGRLLRLGPSSVANALRHMEAAGLVAGHRFRHPAARSAVLDDFPWGLLRRQRLDVAELLHHEGLPTPTVARHLVAVRHVPPGWAVPVLMDASEQARRSGDVGFALECLELALSGSDDAREQALTTMMLVRLEWQLNPSMVTPRLGPLCDALLTGVLPARLTVPLSRALLWHGRFDEAAEVIRALGPKVPGPHGQVTETREWLRNRYPVMVPLLPAEDGPGIRDSREPAAARPLLLAETVLGSTLRNGGDESSARSAEQVLRSCPLDDTSLYALESALLALVYADRLGQASVWSAKLLQEATARQAPTWQAKLTAIRAELALRQGDLPEACALARSAMTHLSPRSWGVAVGAPLSTLVLAATAMGADDVTEEYLRHSVPEAISESRYGLQYLYARGHHHLAAGRVHAALDDFLRCGDQARAWDMDLPAFLPWRSGAAAAHLRLGQRDQVRRLADAELARPGSAKSRSRGVAMCLLAEIAEPRRRASLLLEAVGVLRLTGDRLELARALAALSSAQRAIGEAELARRALYQALHLADVCGAERLQPSQSPRGREGAPPDPVTLPRDPLSAAERRVASLAALGNSNREIADQLCVTISTVEQHLTRVYRKLNVTRRAELPREFKALAVGSI